MSSRVQRSSRRGVYHSQFYRDLSSPLKLDFSAQSQPSSYSSPWRHTFDGPDPPPPPILSLEERLDFPPDGPPPDQEFKTPLRTSSPSSSPTFFVHFNSSTPIAQGETAPSNFQTPGSSKWRSPPLWDGGEKQQQKSLELRDTMGMSRRRMVEIELRNRVSTGTRGICRIVNGILLAESFYALWCSFLPPLVDLNHSLLG